MTRTISIKQTLKQSLAVARHDLKKCRLPLIIFAVVATFFTTAVLSLALVNKESRLQSLLSFSRESSMERFGSVTTLLVFLLTSVFALIYCFITFSYLHDKRKADRSMPMPIRAEALFLTKAVTVLLLTVIPSLFFVGIINIISSVSDTALGANTVNFLWQIPLGALACISFYALMAVCSGTKANAALTYLAICFSYTIAAFYVKGMVDSFFLGVPTNIGGTHFLMKALNPFAAYDGNNVVYWLIFSAVCIALSLVLLRFRKAERAQTSFAYRLPCYAVEALVTFIAGMFMGVLFGSNNVTGNAFWGFVFGFALGGATVFTVAHAILFRGFRGILKSLVCFGGAVAAGIILAAVCCFASSGYVSSLPEESDVKSAGFIEFTDKMLRSPGFSNVTATISDSAEDFTDSATIKDIRALHESIIKFAEKRSDASKFSGVAQTGLTDMLSSVLGQSSTHYSFAYKLNDGSTTSRYYDYSAIVFSYMLEPVSDESRYNDDYPAAALYTEDITKKPEYIKKYSPLFWMSADDLDSIMINYSTVESIGYPSDDVFFVENKGEGKADLQKVLEALRADAEEHGVKDPYSNDDPMITLITRDSNSIGSGSTVISQTVLSRMGGSYLFGFDLTFGIPSSYTRTVNALKEIGVLTENGKPDASSKYLYNPFYGTEDIY